MKKVHGANIKILICKDVPYYSFFHVLEFFLFSFTITANIIVELAKIPNLFIELI